MTVGAERRTTLENVICRVSSQAALAMHIDFDEANACILPKHATARMKIAAGRTGNTDRYNGGNSVREMDKETDTEKETCVPEFEGKLITEAVARKLASGSKKKFALAKGVILTPSAKDVLRHAGIEVYWQEGRRPKMCIRDRSYGCGDVLIGLNPVNDTVSSLAEVLKRFDEVKNSLEIPTQICVLGHITTQIEALRPVSYTHLRLHTVRCRKQPCRNEYRWR